jgi:hypothetical protein
MVWKRCVWILIILLLVRCRSTPTPVMPTSVVTSPPTPGLTDTATVTPDAASAATAEADATLIPSKYHQVFVYTIEERDNDGQSLLHVAYPVTELDAINTRLEATAR